MIDFIVRSLIFLSIFCWIGWVLIEDDVKKSIREKEERGKELEKEMFEP
jgi:hypothetical protein